MRQAGTFWAATGLAALAVVLVAVNGILVLGNQSIRAEVDQRQQYINQSIQMSRLDQELINRLGAAALNNNNTALRDLLTSNGVTLVGGQPQRAPGQTEPVPLKK